MEQVDVIPDIGDTKRNKVAIYQPPNTVKGKQVLYHWTSQQKKITSRHIQIREKYDAKHKSSDDMKLSYKKFREVSLVTDITNCRCQKNPQHYGNVWYAISKFGLNYVF